MSDSKDIISLNCPNCQAPLTCKSTEMTVTCEHCGTSVLIKDFITKSRINKNDKLESNKIMAENAFKTKDWKLAYKYYESICKITKSSEDLAIFNALGYICGKIEFRMEYVEKCSDIDIEKRKIILGALKTHVEDLRAGEIRIATNKYRDAKTRKKVYQSINNKYFSIINKINYEIKMITSLKCTCGNVIKYNEDICSSCGKSKQEVLDEIEIENKRSQKFQTLLIIDLAVMLFGIIFGASVFSYFFRGEPSQAMPHLIIAVILLATSILIFIKKLKSTIIKFICDKIPLKNKIISLEDKLNKLFLPVIIAVPVVLAFLLGLCMNSGSTDKDDSSTPEVIETTEPTTKEVNKQTTKVQEKQTEKPTEISTEPATEKPTEPEMEEAVEENYNEDESVIEENNNDEQYEETPQEDYQDDENQFIVYYTRTGSKYHYDGNCNGGTYYECTLDEALAKGLEPCGKCVN